MMKKRPAPVPRDAKTKRLCPFIPARQTFMLTAFTMTFVLILYYMQYVGEFHKMTFDEKKSVNFPPHKEVPAKPEKRPYNSKYSQENDVCFQKTSNLSKTPLDKCKMSFVPPNVKLVSPSLDNIQIGDDVHYRIESNIVESLSVECISGGNFWYAVLTSAQKPKASCAGSVTDHCNGTYDVHVTAAWAGKATFELTLVHTGEAINHLRNIVWPAEDRLAFSGYYKTNKNQTNVKQMPSGICYLRRRGNWSGYCEYPHRKAMGFTTLICQKVDGVPCNALYSMRGHSQTIARTATTLTKDVHYLFTSPNYLNQVQIPNATFTIKVGNNSLSELPSCHPDQPIPPFQGFWKEGIWHSRICAVDDEWIKAPLVKRCVRNKTVVLLGDSTTRQWFHGIHGLIGVRGVRQARGVSSWHFRRVYDSLNATMIYQGHPHVLSGNTVHLKDVKFEVDVLDSLIDPACNYIVVVSPWAHFSQWTRESYVERTDLLRDAVIRLRRRCPDVAIVVKGPHPREHKNYLSVVFANDYLLRQIGLINRDTFSGIGVWFLPVWDLNMAYPCKNTVHMPGPAVLQELKMFFAFICA